MRLVVFFSRGMSLDGWRRAGILDRELALYRSLLPHLEHLAFVTYGGEDDLGLARQVVGIEILPNRWGLPSNLYSVLAPYLHRRTLGRATVFKTNQINGAWCGVIAKWLFRKKLVVRCGYLWSDFMVRLTTSRWRRALAGCLERATFQVADAVIVAGHADRMTIIRRYGVNAECMHVVPNYVDTSLFRVMPEVPRESGRVIFVGRLENQKNPLALIEALKELPGVKLSIIGNGSLRANLEERVREYGGGVSWRCTARGASSATQWFGGIHLAFPLRRKSEGAYRSDGLRPASYRDPCPWHSASSRARGNRVSLRHIGSRPSSRAACSARTS